MQKIGDSTTTANADGEFTNGNPAAGIESTLIKAEWMNTIQRELIAVVRGGGLELDKSRDDQLLQAIYLLGQAGDGNVGVDTGAANAYIVSYTPAVKALKDGMTLRFKAKTANSGASTFSPNGLPAKPILGLAHGALQGGEIIANGNIWLQYSTTIGAGSWILLVSTSGAMQVALASKSQHAVQLAQLALAIGTTQALFDDTLKFATTGFVQKALGNFSGTIIYSSSASLPISDMGKMIGVNSVPAVTLTLPAGPSNLRSGYGFYIINLGLGTVTIAPSGSDFLQNPYGVSSIALAQGESVQIVAGGAPGQWFVIGGSLASQGRYLGTRAITSSGVYNPSPGTSSVIVEVIGGGGSGGGAPATSSGQYSVGGGGGAGAYAKSRLTSGFKGVYVGIGAGGPAGTSSSPGGTTDFAGLITAAGGYGGLSQNNGPNSVAAYGGAGGPQGTTGNITKAGGLSGAYGLHVASAALFPIGGAGAASVLGGGGFGSSGQAGGIALAYGAGGGGASNTPSNAALAGGAGGNGVAYVHEYA